MIADLPAIPTAPGRCAGVLCAATLLLALGASPAAADRWGPWEGRAAFGGEVSATAFGIADLGLRKGPLSLQLYTDTIELRYAPELQRGRYYLALRVETFAAGLMISPWANGAPDPTRAWNAGYAGGEGGYVRYLPASLYVGVGGAARVYVFWARDEHTTVPPPGPTPLFTADAVLGHYTPISHIWVRAGADVELDKVMPHVVVEAKIRPAWGFAPLVEVRAGWAMNQDYITRTRLGGLNPYVVPLAGAGWAEFWVQDYIALRAGPSVRARLPGSGPHTLDLTPVVDFAGFDGHTALGFGLLAKWLYRRYSLEASFGYAPFIERQEGVVRVAGFLLFGIDWGTFGKRKG
jgi:hypothetical protein